MWGQPAPICPVERSSVPGSEPQVLIDDHAALDYSRA